LFDHRFSLKGSGAKGRFSVIFNDLVLLLFIGILAVLKISPIYFLLYMYVMVVAGTMGVWLFYVQHQFEGVYWARHADWNPLRAAFEGCSYYKLPKILQWSTGNIGIHPVHHLRVRIPNYNLQKCYDETPELHAIKMLGIRRSLKSLWLNLWDEKKRKLVSFSSLKHR
jgi:omega-6 fatty acid desaturase (delta-12 desaturase)